MAVYNEDQNLNETIQSILLQTYRNWELIIIDDFSKDKSKEIIKKYVNSDSRIKLIQNHKNIGLPASLNKGILCASGDYIARTDADDISISTRFQKQITFMEKHSSVDVLGTGAEIIDKKGDSYGYINMIENHSEIIKNISGKNLFFHPSVMIKKSFFDKVGLYEESLRKGQDLELWIRGLGFGAKYHNLKSPEIKYRINDKNLTLSSLIQSCRTYLYIAFHHGPIYKWAIIAFIETIKNFMVKFKLYSPKSLKQN